MTSCTIEGVLKKARELGFRIVLVHDAGLAGDRLLGYKRECQAKPILWDDILRKLLDATKKKQAAKTSEEKKLVQIYNTPLTASELLLLRRVLRKIGARPHLYKRDLGDAVQQEVLALLSKAGKLSLAGLEDAADGIGAIVSYEKSI